MSGERSQTPISQVQGQGTPIPVAAAPAVRSENFVPKEALKRFALDLESGNSIPHSKQYIDLNKKRVSNFINKTGLSYQKNKKEEVTCHIPGIYHYPEHDFHSNLAYQNSLEFNTSLGTRSRFGDGDGGFFDMWLANDVITSKRIYSEEGLPTLKHMNGPLSGIKKQYAINKTGSVPKYSTVRPYAEKRKERMEREAKEKAEAEGRLYVPPDAGEKFVDGYVGANIHDAFVSSEMFKLPPLESESKSSGASVSGESTTSKPSLISELTHNERETYFGQNARQGYFDYFKQVANLKKIVTNENFNNMDLSSVDSRFIHKNDAELRDAAESYNKTYLTARGMLSPRDNDDPSSMISNDNADASIAVAGGGGGGDATEDDSPGSFADKLLIQKFNEEFDSNDDGKEDKSKAKLKPVDVKPGGPISKVFDSSTDWDDLDIDFSLEEHLMKAPLGEPSGRPRSARTKFIVACIDNNIQPKPKFIIRKDITPVLNLSNAHFGDTMAKLLAQSIDSIPALEEINIADNSLTDVGLHALITAFSRCPNLRKVNISSNKVDDDAANALSNFLTAPTCNLRELVLRNADIDDIEVSRFILAMAERKCVENIDFSRNLLGSHENDLKVITKKNTNVIGCHSIASLLIHPDCSLKQLCLSWNKIRGTGALAISQSLVNNQSLVHLDVSYNLFGSTSGEILGNALHTHPSIQHLDVSSNKINSRACFTIISGLLSCQSLITCIMKDNQIGMKGADAVVQANMYFSNEVELDISGCAVKIKDNLCTYDSKNIIKNYKFDLSQPYERACAIDLFRQIAFKDELTLAKYTIVEKKGDSPKEVSLNVLTKPRIHRKGLHFNGDNTVSKLFEIGSDVEKAKSIFHEFDVDQNGSLDRDELGRVLAALGLENSKSTINQLLATYDVDGSGVIEEEEFTLFLVSLYQSILRSREKLTSYKYMSLDSKHRSENVFASQYIPPNLGIAEIFLTIERSIPEFMQTLTTSNISSALDNAKGSSDADVVVESALQSQRITYSEASVLYRIMFKDSGDKCVVLEKLVPKLNTPNDVSMLLADTCTSLTDLYALKKVLGPFYRISIGLMNGFYSLNLNVAIDKLCLNKLIEYSDYYNKSRQKQDLGDTSQNGDWTCFRNTFIDGHPFAVTTEWAASELANKGRIEFDFSACNGKSPDGLTIPDNRFIKMLQLLSVIDDDLKVLCKEQMDRCSEFCIRASKGVGLKEWEPAPIFAKEVAIALDGMYEKVQGGKRHSESHLNLTRSDISASERTVLEMSVLGNSKGDSGLAELFAQHIESMKQLISTSSSKTLPEHLVTARIMDGVEQTIGNRFITCSQLSILVDLLPLGSKNMNSYGSWRVELIVVLFSQVVDLINFEHVLKFLKPFEVAAVIFRLGYLNIWCPMKAEGHITLNMARREDLQIARLCIGLSLVEPGENMKDETYKPVGEEEPTPEWKLPLAWATEAGLPRSGIMTLRYYSGAGMHLGGCKADPIIRIALMSVTLAQAYTADLKLTYKPCLERAESLLQGQGGCRYSFKTEIQSSLFKEKAANGNKSPKGSPKPSPRGGDK